MPKKILIISPASTHPPYSGNSKCILSYAEMLMEAGYNVHFLWIADFNTTPEEIKATRNYWGSKLTIFKLNQFHRILKAFFRVSRFNRKGYYKTDDFYPFGIKRSIMQIQKEERFDCVIINYIFLSRIFNFIKGARKVLYAHDVFTNRFQHTGNAWFSVTANEEAKALNRADNTLAIQEDEAIFYSFLTTRRIRSAYTFFRVNDTPFTGKKVLLFLAGKNPHNIEGITLFIEKIFRALIPVHPEIKLLIGGSICSVLNSNISADSIELYGETIDLKEFYSRGDVFINPTINGTGLKIKTFEAMSYGKVVISHPNNANGIYKKEQAPILLAQTTEEYLKYINLLFANSGKTMELKGESIKYINDLNVIVKSRFIEAIED